MTPSPHGLKWSCAWSGMVRAGKQKRLMSPARSWPLPILPERHLLIQFTGLFSNFPGHKMFWHLSNKWYSQDVFPFSMQRMLMKMGAMSPLFPTFVQVARWQPSLLVKFLIIRSKHRQHLQYTRGKNNRERPTTQETCSGFVLVNRNRPMKDQGPSCVTR